MTESLRLFKGTGGW